MMKHWIKIFQLSRNLGKINFSFLNFRYKFKERLDMYFVVLTCFILSLAGVIYYYYFQIVNQVYIELEVLGINAWFYHLVSCGISIVLTIISIFLLINIFCFSKDIENLQLFPVEPCDFFASKYIVVILFCYGIETLLLFPICIIQIQYVGEFSVIITYLSIALILPHIVALPLSVIITICLKISMIFKRPKTLFVITGIIIYFTGIIVYKALSIKQIMSSKQDFLTMINDLLAPFPFFEQYITLHIGLKLFCIIFALLSVVSYYYLSNFILGEKYALYDKEVKIKLEKIAFHSSTKLKSYLKKEYKTFFRNPVYVINGLFGIFITPFLLPLFFRLTAAAKSLEQIRTLVITPEFSFYAVLFALAVIIFTLSINVVASSSFSREGTNFWIAEIIPYSLKQQAFVKVLFSTSISITGIIINCFIFKFYFHYGFIQIGWIVLVSTLFAILWNLIGVFIDMKRPKLDWTNEAEAIKQNINVILSIILCISICVGFCFVTLKMIQNALPIYTIICFTFCSLFALIFLVCKGITSNKE
ncbi:hypothetical protein [Sporofaciens musculi]|jgi:hypothetical protein|uniref:hypothetical protein n=1 Tax=Sporofaciens musculi TaxID=2681861 RepID=UPI00258CD8F1|nr:hypothetical protein [Sporofaciens musculi]